MPPLQLLRRAVGVVLDGRLGIGHGRRLQELGAEEPRVDDGGGDAQRRDLLLQRLHPALEAELRRGRSEEHTSELQSQSNLVCRLLLEKKKKKAHEFIPLLKLC